MDHYTNKKSGRLPGSAMRTAALAAIIIGSIVAILGLIGGLSMILIQNSIINSIVDNLPIPGNNPVTAAYHKMLFGFGIFIFICSLLNVPSIIANSLLVKGRLNSAVVPGILAIISLGSLVIGIICGIVILTSKFADQKDPNVVNNPIYQNFHVPVFGQNKRNATKDEVNAMQQKIKDLEQKINEQKIND